MSHFNFKQAFLVSLVVFTLSILWLVYSTNSGNRIKVASFEKTPKEEFIAIQNMYKGAKPYPEALDSLLNHLKKFDIQASSILLGQSTCVDDITNTKDKYAHPEIMGPFNFGGLAGLPVTGKTGLSAYAHHVPDEGTAMIFAGPHVGYNAKDGWGSILRHNQKHRSACCGALVAALTKLQKGEISLENSDPEDYQESQIEQLALKYKDRIMNAANPLLELTKLVSLEARHQITRYALKLKDFPEIRYVVLINGTIINTDYQYCDYLFIESVTVLDVKRKAWLEWERPL